MVVKSDACLNARAHNFHETWHIFLRILPFCDFSRLTPPASEMTRDRVRTGLETKFRYLVSHLPFKIDELKRVSIIQVA
jgi:hypothetical protein